LKIGLFNESAIQTFIFTADAGSYELLSDTIHLLKIETGELLYISLLDSQLSIRNPRSGSILVPRAQLRSSDSMAVFILRPAFPAMEARKYQGNCEFTVGIGRIQAINEVNLNDYLSAVVSAEGGNSATIEYYKAQAVLCRTYLLAHEEKHSTDGFNLCDGVHCQAYHGINIRNAAIRKAVHLTENEVAVYSDSLLITAAYHANCGGETQNSENEWLQMVPYLRSVKDSFCQKGRNGKWEMKIPKAKWIAYLAKNGIRFGASDSLKSLGFEQQNRKAYYIVNDDSIAFRKIRTDWSLKSSFFSVRIDSSSNIVLHGRGYGHGIGMCQVGAMNMAINGLNYREILNFYFKDISIKKAEELHYNGKKLRLYTTNL
jgi:stage II sporulation protein D